MPGEDLKDFFFDATHIKIYTALCVFMPLSATSLLHALFHLYARQRKEKGLHDEDYILMPISFRRNFFGCIFKLAAGEKFMMC